MGFLLAAAVLGGLAVAAVVLLVGVVLKTVFWAVTLPVRLVFGLIFGLLLFPLWLIKTALRLVGFLVLGPVLAVGGVLLAGVVLIAGLLAVLVPLLPILIITFLIWMVVRSFSHRTVPTA